MDRREADALLLQDQLQHFLVRSRLSDGQGIDKLLLMALVLSRTGVQDDASAKGLHWRIEPDDKPVGALDGQWLVKPELHKGALACTDGILI